MQPLNITISGMGGVGLSDAAKIIAEALKKEGFKVTLNDPEALEPKDFDYVHQLVIRDQLDIVVDHRPWGG